MKKTLTIISGALLLSACANMGDSAPDRTIFDDGDYTETRQVIIEEKTKPAADKTYQRDMPVEIVEGFGTYQLPTRDERYDEYAPTAEIFAIPAARATNKMLDETRDLYENTGDTFLFITDLKKNDRKMPDGIYNAERTTRKIIEGSKTFKVVNDKSEADYILETIIDNAGTPEEPILVYRMILLDTENQKINEWVETFKRLSNDDRSWW